MLVPPKSIYVMWQIKEIIKAALKELKLDSDHLLLPGSSGLAILII